MTFKRRLAFNPDVPQKNRSPDTQSMFCWILFKKPLKKSLFWLFSHIFFVKLFAKKKQKNEDRRMFFRQKSTPENEGNLGCFFPVLLPHALTLQTASAFWNRPLA
jgi:hypothetical protein